MQYGLGMLHANENIFYLLASTESFLNSLKSFLSLSVYCELLILFLDFLNDLFHDVISLLVKH